MGSQPILRTFFFTGVRGGVGCKSAAGDLASSEVRSGRTTSAFLELAGRFTAEAEVVARPAARTPHPTRAGGQDDGSYTNSLKLHPSLLSP